MSVHRGSNRGLCDPTLRDERDGPATAAARDRPGHIDDVGKRDCSVDVGNRLHGVVSGVGAAVIEGCDPAGIGRGVYLQRVGNAYQQGYGHVRSRRTCCVEGLNRERLRLTCAQGRRVGWADSQ